MNPTSSNSERILWKRLQRADQEVVELQLAAARIQGQCDVRICQEINLREETEGKLTHVQTEIVSLQNQLADKSRRIQELTEAGRRDQESIHLKGQEIAALEQQLELLRQQLAVSLQRINTLEVALRDMAETTRKNQEVILKKLSGIAPENTGDSTLIYKLWDAFGAVFGPGGIRQLWNQSQ
ncbi:MAG: hypothetical protein A3D96_07145 [Chlamydiae bacterium RIFCSPHIGHO2_12_FULL_44_59]|nr:MAG: hypothetical protein A2796_06155 [Chlamydiae bacterium RIFCSPHIGHO2_01_FULL_44_39]OGN59215.1 MAG: hypothetical protein A3C42_04625 [Chlamydiae bacterium RIFCSPHIGHO2_02_FULL_45_9]OGN59458.1 MAG: hypothetical protein A3D96_07145 [Chlamydiae bacterium RIFCSPHIGHO2_12_FULL_44_59]OGN67211.1 MAG: hypothetical protein A2978_03530 [Chlamydiae bacterium RIFCSPLOWO2_01_FULL_44_52]OGN67408.1 MAG: hypothetical protein A3I67_01100 [Chlamydiae bacterium RIFCSPLOWO2_02_FULL_45_22]OGN69140.1 MAG: hyp